MKRYMLIWMLLLILPGSSAWAQAQRYTFEDLTPMLDGATGTYMVMASLPDSRPAVAWRESGSQFGSDRVLLQVFVDGDWQPIDTTPMMDPLTSQVSERGIAIVGGRAGGLVLAVNRVLGERGFDQYGTVVAQWDGTAWSPLGDPLGDAPSTGPLRLVGLADTYAVGWFTENAVEVHLWRGDRWQDIGADLALPEGMRPLSLDITAAPEGIFMALAVMLPSGEVQFSLKQYMDDGWRMAVDLPNLNDVQIGLASLVGIASEPQTGFYVATAEETGQASVYVSVWNLSTQGTWRELTPPAEAAESPCARNHAVSADERSGLVYAWTADCRNRLNVVRLNDSGGWDALGESATIGAVSSEEPVMLRGSRDGTLYVGWMEAEGDTQSIHVAAYRPQ